MLQRTFFTEVTCSLDLSDIKNTLVKYSQIPTISAVAGLQSGTYFNNSFVLSDFFIHYEHLHSGTPDSTVPVLVSYNKLVIFNRS